MQRTAFLEFRITDKTGVLDKTLPAMDRVLRQAGGQRPARASRWPHPPWNRSWAGTARRRTAPAADSTATPARDILQSLIRPGSDIGLQPMPGEYAVPEEAYPRVDSLLRIPEVAAAAAAERDLALAGHPVLGAGTAAYRLLYVLEGQPIITGQSLVDAQAQLDQVTQGAIVTFELDRAGGRIFGRETAKHINDYMAIILDDRVQGRPPVIQGQITRNGQITLGNKTIQEAQDLALTLKAGALPVPLKIVERRQVGPSLGADSVHDGVVAGVVGTLLVVIIMVGYYRVSGLLAVAGLALYLLFALGGLAMVDATLTLPGLAGLVLSIGIAVDANVLIFERIREELALGKTVRLLDR